MSKSNEKKEEKQEVVYDVENEPIILPKPVLDKFFKQDKPGDLIALYSFYYYTAKWQKTNQPTHWESYGRTAAISRPLFPASASGQGSLYRSSKNAIIIVRLR